MKIKRKSKQPLMPQCLNEGLTNSEKYRIHPFHTLDSGSIFRGFPSLVDWIGNQETVVIDGYVGVDWETISARIKTLMADKGLSVNIIDARFFLKDNNEINELVTPFLGEKGSVWGKVSDLDLSDFFRLEEMQSIVPDTNYPINIVIGVGASFVGWDAPVIYLDLPKNELIYRMRAGAITNIGQDKIESINEMYKRFYFVDWIVCNKHKCNLLDRIALIADTQWEDISWMTAEALFTGLRKIAQTVIRPRPWFDPGAWGGQWMKSKIPGLSPEEPNYAWSFEIIAPENGLVFESGGNLLEVSFDTLMFKEYRAVLGKHAEQYKAYFPIRFDFLDTFDGGNLSIQCHPSLSYIQHEFGEQFTQDETYYILDCKDDAMVYLGFQETIDPVEFRQALETSKEQGVALDMSKYIQTHRSTKHDLYLIPNKTVHGSGKNNMVLEISATPYIFTFKMYDWLQRDLAGNLRPINIEHAFNNLDFDRKGEKVEQELIATPYVLDEGDNWSVYHLPTHRDHYYDVHRIEFEGEVTVDTENTCHLLMLVEGTSIKVVSGDGVAREYYYAETFIIPAEATPYTLQNKGSGSAKVIKAFLK